MIRAFSIRDFASLQRNRDDGYFLNSSRTLTWGKGAISIGAFSAPISNATGVFTAISSKKINAPFIGQVVHNNGAPFAYFTYLTPQGDHPNQIATEMVHNLTKQVGERGAFCLIAEVEENSEAYDVFRLANFNVFSHQQIWHIEEKFASQNGNSVWREVTYQDQFNIQKLYNAIVPAMVQQVETPPWEHLKGFVSYQDDELIAFADIVSGPSGVWVQPYFHPDLVKQEKYLRQLFGLLGSKNKRPIYLCVRAYQSWLNGALTALNATAMPTQVLMAKHMTINLKSAPMKLKTINNTEPTTPYANRVEKAEELG